MNANTNAQTLVLELDTIISNTTSDIELQQFHYILKRDFEATLESLKELIIQDQYNIQKLFECNKAKDILDIEEKVIVSFKKWQHPLKFVSSMKKINFHKK